MSSYLCDTRHIGGLASWFVANGSENWIWSYVIGKDCPTFEGAYGLDFYELAPTLAQMMAQENINSVSERYPDDEEGQRPGPADIDTDLNYIINCRQSARRAIPPNEVTAVELLQAVKCYEYQSCYHEGWDGSPGHRIAQVITSAAIAALPGYDAATWGWPKVAT